jgi:hypothetical protein
MISISEAEHEEAKPDAFSYSTVLRVLAREGMNDIMAQELLDSMEKQ